MWERIKAPFRNDETPWCAAFVGSNLELEDIVSSRAASARSYERWGQKLYNPAVGAIVVFWRGSPSGWSGHVGFITGVDRSGNLLVLGGNQGDMVSIKAFSTSRVLSYRWPAGEPLPGQITKRDTIVGKISINEA
jgi:uncharacterized protein (TIGR02594 family)